MPPPVEADEKGVRPCLFGLHGSFPSDGWEGTREYTCRKCCKKGASLCPCATEHIQVQKKQIRRNDEPERVLIRCKACPDVQVPSGTLHAALIQFLLQPWAP